MTSKGPRWIGETYNTVVDDELRQKINRELAEPITTERQVVYLLVQIRKLMDRLNQVAGRTALDPRFRALGFLCNWIVHTDLSSGWAQEPLAFFERHADDLLANNLTPTILAQTNSIFGLETVRDEMCQFFKEGKLNRNSLPFNAAEWAAFLRLYVAIISECTLIVKPPHARVLRSAKVTGYEHLPWKPQ